MPNEPGGTPVITTKRTDVGYTPGETIYTGDQIVSFNIARVTREWQPKEKSAQRFKDDVIRRIEQIFNNTSIGTGGGEDDEEGGGGTSPDLFFDSGYFLLEHDSTATIKHNLGQIPTRFTIFCSEVVSPQIGTDMIQLVAPGVSTNTSNELRGFWVTFPTLNTVKLWGGESYVWSSWADAYLRVLMWK